MVQHVHAEIEYKRSSDGVMVHSDVCPPDCLASNMTSADYRTYLHDVLDEWLDNSNGTGLFYICEEGHIFK